jgi:hypothetical protein
MKPIFQIVTADAPPRALPEPYWWHFALAETERAPSQRWVVAVGCVLQGLLVFAAFETPASRVAECWATAPIQIRHAITLLI